MKVFTDVKINLGLHVLRRRPDGFHDIETLFVPYRGLGDELEISPASEEGGAGGVDIRIWNCSWDPQKDLTVKAWRLLKEDFPELPAVRIRLRKGAPVGAGLGGGSADAACALRMISEIFALGLSSERLAAYAARLGSDCAFFIYDTPMLGSGRGEILEPFDMDLSAYELRVEAPEGVSVSTKEAYAGIRPREDRAPLREILAAPVEQWRELLHNDFEDSVFPAYPQIRSLKESLYERGAVYAAMSGSGSAVFGLFRK